LRQPDAECRLKALLFLWLFLFTAGVVVIGVAVWLLPVVLGFEVVSSVVTAVEVGGPDVGWLLPAYIVWLIFSKEARVNLSLHSDIDAIVFQ
jgi:hypothetical protein